jgi:hypothetical protein
MGLDKVVDLALADRTLSSVVADRRNGSSGSRTSSCCRRWAPNELFVRRLADLRRRQDNLGQFVQPLLLLLDQELGVTDQIDEQNAPDLEAKIVLRFRRHNFSFAETESQSRLFSGRCPFRRAQLISAIACLTTAV